MEWISRIPAKPKEFGGGGLYVEHGSWSDGDRIEAEGVTPLWTVFHLCNYFGRYFANFGIFEDFEAKKAKLGAETREKILTPSRQAPKLRVTRVGWSGGIDLCPDTMHMAMEQCGDGQPQAASLREGGEMK